MNSIKTQLLVLLAMLLIGTGAANAADVIRIAGKDVTSSNANDVLGDGHFKYDSSTKTLTVTNANLKAPGNHAIYAVVDGLTIKLVGYNEFNSKYAAFCLNGSCTITGSGALRANCNRGIILAKGGTTTIDGPTLRFICSEYGVFDNTAGATLQIQGSSTKVRFINELGFSYDLYNLSLGNDLHITHPYNGQFDAAQHTILFNGQPYTGRTLISSSPTEEETWYGLYIGETAVTNYNYDDINNDDMFVYRPGLKTLDVRSGSFFNDGPLGGGIDNRAVDGLTVHLTGSQIDLTTRNCPLYSEKSFSVTGPGTLNATSTTSSALVFGGTGGMTCTIGADANGKSPTINLIGRTYGVRDFNTTMLDIEDKSTVNMTPGSGYEAVYDLANFMTGNNVTITEPLFGSFDPDLKSIKAYHADTAYKGKVSIGPSYYLYVGGVSVTPQNDDYIKGDAISGNVSYDASTKTLTLEDATIKPTNFNAIQNDGVADLNIKVVGTNTLDCDGAGGLQLLLVNRNTSITGDGTLYLNTELNNFCARVFGSCLLSIDGPTVIGSSNITCIDFTGSGRLAVSGANTKVNFTSLGDMPVFANLDEFTLERGLYITKPVDGAYSPTVKSITTDGEHPFSGNLLISSQMPGPLMYIGETRLTTDNARDILGDGTFSYDKATKTLTVRDANLTNYGSLGSCISNREVEGLTIRFYGTNTLNARMSGIASDHKVTITGPGTVYVSSTEGYALNLLCDNDTCTIDGVKLYLTGNESSSPLRDYRGTATLAVRGSGTLISMEPAEGGKPIHNLGKLDLGEGIYINEPAGGYFSEALKTITVDGTTPYTGKALIGEQQIVEYGIYVAETMVSSANCADILGDGCFSYDAERKTLTVRDATLENYGTLGSGISNRDVDWLYIHVEGTNTFRTRNSVIDSSKNLIINGTGTLNGTSTSSSPLYFAGSEQMWCWVSGPTLNLSSETFSAIFDYESTTTLFLAEEATQMTLQSAGEWPTVLSLHDFVIDTCLQVIQPDGAWFDAELKSFTTDGETSYAGTIVIGKKQPVTPPEPESYGLSVAGIAVTSENASDVLGDSTVVYNPEWQSLTLSDARLSSNGGPIICNYGVDGLTLFIDGYNSIKAYGDAIETQMTMHITGKGTLDGYATGGCGLRLASQQGQIYCDVSGPSVYLGCDSGAVVVDDYATAGLLVSGSLTKLALNPAAGYPAISNLGYLVVDTCLTISEPAGAWFDPDLHTVTVDGRTPYHGSVVISEPLPPVEVMMAFVLGNSAYVNCNLTQNIAEPFTSPSFQLFPPNTSIVWGVNISENPDEGGEPIRVEVNTDPTDFYVRLLNPDTGTGQTNLTVVVYDERVTAMATLDIAFYADTYQQPDTTCIAVVADTAGEEVVVNFGGDDSDITENTDLSNRELDGVLFTLDDWLGDGYDSVDQSIVLNSTMSVEEVEAVLELFIPGSGAYAAMFSGMTFLLPAGSGTFDLDFLTLGERELTVKIGSGAAATFRHNERGTVSISYECDEDTYVYIYGSEAPYLPDIPETQLIGKRAPRRAYAQPDAVKVYGLTVKPTVIGSEDYAKGDVNRDGSVDVADIASVISHMAGTAQYEAADVNNDGTVDVADIATIITIMAELARRL